MVGRVVRAVTITVALFEVLGFIYLESQLSVIGIPANLTGLQIFELPRWGLEALNEAIPGPVIFVLVILIWCSFGAFVIDQIGGPVRIVRSINGGSVRSWIALTSVELQLTFREQIPFIQISCTTILVIWSISWAGSQGAKSGNIAIAATSPEFAQRFHVRYSVHLNAAPGRSLPAGIRSENQSGSLALLWQDSGALYVAARRCEIHQDNVNSYLIWFAIARADVSSMKYTRMWDRSVDDPLRASKMNTKQRIGDAIERRCENLIKGLRPAYSVNEVWALCAVVISTFVVLGYASLRAFLSDYSSEAILSSLVVGDAKTLLRGSLPLIRTVYSVLARGRDVEIATVSEGKVIVREVLRYADVDASMRYEVTMT